MAEPHVDSMEHQPPIHATSAPDVCGDVDRVYRSYAGLLLNFVKRKFGIPADEARGIVHDVFATYIANQSAVTNVGAYLVAAVCWAAKRHRHKRRGEGPLADAETLSQIDTAIEAITTRMTLESTMGRLDAPCQEILRRRYIEDQTTEMIALGMRIKHDNVHYRLHGCRKRLREMYRELTRVRR
jgi:RNA polymerase sigma factor (sigma-70 family)